MNMNEKYAYRYLEEQFVATFLDELIPGIFHNFANPLNGIMGRSKLMQRRLISFIEKIAACNPDMQKEMDESGKKLISDINAIANESEKFYDLFRVSTGKFYAIGAHNMDRLNLSSLIEAEMGFADFYLDFKHNVRKDIRIDHEMPDVSGITAFYSMAIWALIRQSTKNYHDANDQTFMITTDHDDQWVSVTINNIDGRLLQGWQGVLSDTTVGSVKFQDIPNNQKDLFYALLLLIKSSAGVEITHDGDAETLTVRIPHHLKKKEV
jgi:signal transduction histidine kinase